MLMKMIVTMIMTAETTTSKYGETTNRTGKTTIASGKSIAMTDTGEKYTLRSGMNGINGTKTMKTNSISTFQMKVLNLIFADKQEY